MKRAAPIATFLALGKFKLKFRPKPNPRRYAERMAEEKRKDAERLAIEEWNRAFPLTFQSKPNLRRYAERMADEERQARRVTENDNTSMHRQQRDNVSYPPIAIAL
jgi:hypothetical protein